MNQVVKRFFVMALPLLMAGPIADEAYSIRIENNAGIQFEDVAITSEDHEFNFGVVPEGETTGLGHADLQFGKKQPRQLEIAFRPKNDDRVLRKAIELPNLGQGESVKISIGSYLDLIRGKRTV